MIDLSTTSRQYLLPEELAEIFLVSRRTVYHWIEDERIRVVQVAHSIRIPIDEARKLLQVKPRTMAPSQHGHSTHTVHLTPPSPSTS
jgi:excisionase family DNA binding protein